MPVSGQQIAYMAALCCIWIHWSARNLGGGGVGWTEVGASSNGRCVFTLTGS